MKQKFKWEWPSGNLNIQPTILKFRRDLQDNGFRESVIETYVFRVSKYLQFAGLTNLNQENFDKFRQTLHTRGLKRSTINGYCIAIRAFHKLRNEEVKYKFLRISDQIPYYFSEEDVIKIFSVIDNFKHYVMLNTLFYGCLRVSELCGLNDEDVDLENLNLRVYGKGGVYGLALINQHCANIIKSYLEMRPSLKIDDKQPLFYTDYKNRWNRMEVSRMFHLYKLKAQIDKPGGAHVFARHTSAYLMVKNGCDLLTIKEVLRHKSIESTMRYLHLADDTKRLKYDKFLKL
jgi:site-specific recombinase XerD